MKILTRDSVLLVAIFCLLRLRTRKLLLSSTEWLEESSIFTSSLDQLRTMSLNNTGNLLDFRHGSLRGVSDFTFAGLGVRYSGHVWLWPYSRARYGYHNISETMEQVARMRDANVPLEGMLHLISACPRFLTVWRPVMWNDIDLYHAYRDFTTDPNRFPADQVRTFIEELVSSFEFFY